jgi:hypothetical protein
MRPRLIAALLACACSSSPHHPPPQLTPAELALRTKLGIPLDAERVIVFGQNAHLDVDWQRTFDDYYTTFVEHIFLSARQILDAQPRAFYSIAEMSYLQHHLTVHPEELAPMQADVARGALRIVGGGMTSPDTLLPESELLARDWLYGIKFAEDTLGAHPTAAWLPDSFGHGGTAPDVLAAAGYTSVAFSRVDGAPDLLGQLVHPNDPPLAGSTAEKLQQLGTADFYWDGTNGASIFAHFLSGVGLYCEGDNLDYQEDLEPAGMHSGPFKGDDPTFTDASIDRYIGELVPYARTPYLFVPVGCDFADPKERLLEYVDGYNARRYPITHVWAVAAPFEDYATLASARPELLPHIAGELSPYYMGFYGSRADVKRATRDAARPYFTAEPYAALLGAAGATITTAAQPMLELLTRADHHDWVTGTAADDVVTNEQLPVLAMTRAAGEGELGQIAEALAQRIPITAGAVARLVALDAASDPEDDVITIDLPVADPAVHTVAGGVALPMELVAAPATFRIHTSAAPYGWQAIDILPGAAPAPPAGEVSLALTDDTGAPAAGAAITHVVLSSSHVRAEWVRVAGVFALTSLDIDGAQAITQPSMVVHDYGDMGGLWRLGNEMNGCAFTPLAPASDTDDVQVLVDGALEKRVAFVSSSGTIREAAVDVGVSGLDVAITTAALEGTTRTVSFSFAAPAGSILTTSLPFGSEARVAQHIYTPTFWPAVSWAGVNGWSILLRQSTGVMQSTTDGGTLELMAVRDAVMEQCDLEGGMGNDTSTHRIEWRIVHTYDDPAAAERAAQAFDRPIDLVAVDLAQATTTDLSTDGSLASVAGAGVITAVKPAERGDGVIVRVSLSGAATLTLAPFLLGKQLTLDDLAERDLRELGTTSSTIALDPAMLGERIVTLRIH